MQMWYAWRYSQHVSQSPDDCEGCVTTCSTNFTAKAFTLPWVEEINREADVFEKASRACHFILFLDTLDGFYTSTHDRINISGN